MDRIRIVGGQRLNGTIPISGAKNATLPLMIASLLTEDTLILDNVPRLADVGAAAANSRQSRRRHHGQRQALRRDRRPRPDAAHFRRPHCRHHRALRTGVEDARELLGDRAARCAHGPRRGSPCRAAAPSARGRSIFSSWRWRGSAPTSKSTAVTWWRGRRTGLRAARSSFPKSPSAAPIPRSWRPRSPTARP